jgi:hypothetical protein
MLRLGRLVGDVGASSVALLRAFQFPVELLTERGGVPLERRQPHVGVARLESRDRRLGRAHACGHLGLGQTEVLTDRDELGSKVTAPLRHFPEAREHRFVTSFIHGPRL